MMSWNYCPIYSLRMMKNNLKELKQRALAGDLTALEELRQLGVLSGNKSKYSMAPSSFAQRRLWFIDKMDQSPAYNLPGAILLEGNLNFEALENAFKEIVRRHEILRTCFVETDGIPYQKIFDEVDFKVEKVDLCDAADKDEKVLHFLAEESKRCFDLSKGPLLLCRILKLDESKHLLLFNMHHIISDGWSIGVLISELTTLYNSFCAGESSPLEPLKIQYKDYVYRHLQILKEEDSASHRSYWMNKLAGEIQVLELPSDFSRPFHKTFNGQLYEIEFGKELHLDIKNHCRQGNVSLFMFIVSAVTILLNKYTGKSDILVGSPIAGREQRDLEDQIGFYVNTIPLRNQVDSTLSYSEFLKIVRHNCIEAYDHQVYPFDLLVEDLNLERDTSRNPLFEIVLSLQEADSDSIRLNGIKSTVMKPEITFSKFDLHFNFEESSDRMKLGIIYNPDLYGHERIERLAGHLLVLLKNILTAPDLTIGKLEIISATEKEQILKVFNDTTCYYPKESTIAGLFEEMAEEFPDKPAVVYQGKPLCYRDLNEKANSLAHHLVHDFDLKLDEPVVLLMDRSHELIIAILAVLKAGGAYLPIDIKMPLERINVILNDVNARIVFSDIETSRNIYAAPSVIRINESLFSLPVGSGNIKCGKTSSNLAYILYTSGSTGKPKGSLIEEKSVIRLVRNTNYTRFDDSVRLFSTSSISFDATTWDIWGALLNGGTLYFENSEDYLDPEMLKSYLSTYKINRVFFPTGLFVRMVEADIQHGLKLFEGLDEVGVGGDKLPVTTSNKFVELYPDVSLFNGYGPTENTTFTACYSVKGVFQETIPIGKPISNTTVFIVDPQGNLCPFGIPGELYIGGDGLSRGYVNRPDLNKEKFVILPSISQEKLYRSGDIGFWDIEGNIHFVGRIDDQLKIRGYRIETGEIENVTSRYEGIIHSKILVIQEEDQKQLALYYTCDNEIGTEDLKRKLGKELPEYMVPKYFIRLDEFPLNQNGKVDYKAFPKPEINSAQIERISDSISQIVRKLEKIFETILNVQNISASDNFFVLGGHSLKAIRAVSAIQKELSVKVNLKEFFSNPTIQSLEEIIRNKKRESLGVIPVIPEASYYLLSHAQKRLWVLDKIEKSKSTYNIPLAVTIYEEIDPDALQQAFDEMVQKHESLRTIFIEENGDPYQKIVSGLQIPVSFQDFSGESDPGKSTLDYVVAEAHRPFILSEYPLVRLAVVKTAARKQVLFLNIHHIICDGWSLNIMVDELFGGYKRRLEKAESPVVMPQIQYKDYSYWLNERINNPESNADRAYWLEKLKGEITPLDIPTDFRRPVVKTYQGNSNYYSFSKEMKKNLDTFNIEKRSSLFMTLVAAIKVLLNKYSGKEDIIIGTPVAGRDHPDLENQIGYYVNTLALRDHVSPQKTFAELLAEVKRTATDGYTHQMYPFDKLVEEIKLPRDTSRSPLFDVMVVLQNFDISYREVFKRIESYQIPMNMSKFDLTFNFSDTGENLDLLIEYNTQLYKKERIDQIASHLFVLLETVMVNPAQELLAINVIGKEEQENLLRNYNDTSAAYPHDKTIVQLVEATVDQYPSNPAVVYKEKVLTYAELNRRTNILAHFLLENFTISSGEAIGVLVPPSDNTIVILLAILKAGGAYVPIDSEYPDERIKHILSDSKTNIFITQNEHAGRLNRLVEETGVECTILDFDELPGKYGLDESNPVGINSNPDTTAYIIFTSGSTGKPKGCPISHRNLVRLFINEKCNYDFNSSDVWIMAHSYCFDLSVWEMYGAFLFGGKIIVPDRSEVRDISAFVRLVHDHGITILTQTPGAFYKFIDTALESKFRKTLSIRYVIFGGEKLNPAKLANWIKAYPPGKVKLVNMYGITETTIHVTYHLITEEEIVNADGSSNVGVPLPETKVYILDNQRMLTPIGIYGEIYVAGTGLSKGYLNRPELTAERFIPNPYDPAEILYKSGDIARWIYDGTMEYLDRCDNQVQIRGFRVEMTEIELQLRQYPGIVDAVVVANDKEGTKELAAYLVSDNDLMISKLKSFLLATLPDYMIPSHFIQIEKIPLTPNGKLDKKSLPPAIQNIASGAIFAKPVSEVEVSLLELWQEVLSTESISIHDNFFDLGGNSILLVKLYGKINALYPDVLELTDLFSKSKISEQAGFISQKMEVSPETVKSGVELAESSMRLHDMAVVGMASRIGDCETPDEFWKDLCMGVDFIGGMPSSRIPDIKALAEKYGVKPDALKFREYCYLPEVDKFDHGFFKLSPSEASLIDPGQRMFMETACHALEDAGYGGNKLSGSRTGIFIGASDHLGEYARFIEHSDNRDPNLLLVAQTPSILAGRLSYHLNLKGPALLVDSACSSSLVALHLACQSLREGKIDSALVGGVKLHLLPFDSDTRIEIDSSDSRAHSFDDSANGTGAGEGIIAIFIKPLEHALRDCDNIYAVIKGSEINQDGNSNGITAPNAGAQADAIENAWLDAGIDPTTVSFIETHGTATKLGDPIEIDGITKAFQRYTSERGICAIGAVKANIGHLDTAAGLAGFLKAVLSLKHRQLTPMVHFKTPNRNINFEGSAAFVNTDLKDWETTGMPLRCGVSSFGLSGTNCHVVLEEAPSQSIVSEKVKGPYLCTISSRSKGVLVDYARKIKHALYQHMDTAPENICYTLATGRGHHSYRIAIIFEDIAELIRKISQLLEMDFCSVEAEGIFYHYSKSVASNKKELTSGEITENDLHDLSFKINAEIKANSPDKELLKSIAQSYVKGCEILWEEFYRDPEPSKISLPGYPFEKKRCWVKLNDTKKVSVHQTSSYGQKYDGVFLNNCLIDTPSAVIYATTLNEGNWLLNEHRVMGMATLVGASYLQMAYEAGINHFGSPRLQFEDFYLLHPLTIEEGNDLEVLTTVNRVGDDLNVEVQSKLNDNNWRAYAKFRIGKGVDEIEAIDVSAIKTRTVNSREILPKEEDLTNEEIVRVSKKWNCLKRLYWNDSEILAELNVPEEDLDLASDYFLYPPLMDAALSCAIDESGFLPYSFGTVEVRKRATGKVFSYIKRHENGSSETRTFDIIISDEAGEVIVQLKNFLLRKVALQKQENYFHELVWKPWRVEPSKSQARGSVVVIYNQACNHELIANFKAIEGIILCEIVQDNFPEIFKAFQDKFPDKIIFVLPLNASFEKFYELEERLNITLYSAFKFAKYLITNISSRIDLLFVSENVCEISGNESQLNSLNHSVAGLGQVIQQESPNIHCRFLDIDQNTSVAEILDEINEGFTESYYFRAIRNGERFIREIRPVRLAEKKSNEFVMEEDGVYLITGGTGGIGLELAHFLAKQAGIKLALISRSEFPSRDKWDTLLAEQKEEKLCHKIEKIRAIEKEGADVCLYAADAGNYDELKSTIEKIRKDLGRIRGTIHAAGIAGDGFIFGKDFGTFRDVIRPKIQGTIFLSGLLKADKPDFFVMTSALTAIIPTSGQSDYTAANSFIDAYSSELNRSGMNAVSINLTSWKETGMAFDHGVVDDGIFKSISTADGVTAIGRIMRKNIQSIILGETELSEFDASAGMPFYAGKEMLAGKKRTVKLKFESEISKQIVLHGRESGEYSAFEKTIAQIWGTVLGYSELNISDNYYDLGGDSIHAIKINGLLEKNLKIQVTIGDLFNHLTISELAGFLESKAGIVDISQENDSAFQAILPVKKSRSYPVSSAQRRLYILDQLTKDKLNYHLPEVWSIKGKLRIDAFVSAFEKIIERHEILRTSFDFELDVPVQVVHDKVHFPIPFSHMTESQARDHIRGFVQPFDLGLAPLFRIEIIELAPDNHLVLFDSHHIIMDAFSIELLKKEIFCYYEGKEPEPLKIQYKDYASWQAGYYKSAEAKAKKSYWIRQFEGEIPLLNLPLDFPRSLNQATEAGVFTLCLDEKLTAEVKKLSAGQGISTFMILLGVYNIILHKYSGQEDIIIGVSSMGRDNEALSGLIGMFINNLPVRSFPHADSSISTFLQEVKEHAIMASANQDYPFDELIEDLKINRDLNRTPLFDVVFSYMNFALSEMQNGDLKVSDFKAETVVSSEYDLMLYGLEAEDKIYITIKYKKSLFKKESIERFAGHFSKTVEIVTSHSELKLSDINMLLPLEIERLMNFNLRYDAIFEKSDALDLLHDSFSKNQAKIALLCRNLSMSYQELNERANQLANYLQLELLVKPDDLIGIMTGRTETMIIAILGVLKSGAAYVGIDINYPEQRIDYILQDSRTKVLLTEKGIIEKGTLKTGSETMVVDLNGAPIARHNSHEPACISSFENLAYIIYTSGSTGNPKGVAITHKNLSVFLHFCLSEFKSTVCDVIYATASYCFDISVFEFIYPLITGKSIRILQSALEIPEYLGKDQNVLINLVPSSMLTIIEELERGGIQYLSAINMGGEQIPQALIDRLDCDCMEVRNLYGPSEDTTYTTIYRFSNQERKVLIGKPLSNTQIYIVDKNINLIPLGHAGEICISGDKLAKGYLYKEELTREKFIANPFGDGRLYKTGDLGRWTDSGDLEYLGRLDRQVKIRGFRIELGEIETNIRRFHGVEHTVVLAFEKDSTKDIVAYFAAHEEIDVSALKTYLGKIMPAYMIPLYFVQIGNIPLTPNGKVDVKALPDPELFLKDSNSSEIEVLSPVELSLAEIWKNVLGIESVSKNSSFFDLGGHSLKAMRLLSQINREFRSGFLLSDIFENQTITQLSQLIVSSMAYETPAIMPLQKADYYDVSHAQHRLWILDRVEKNSIVYNIPIVYHIQSAIDVKSLQQSFYSIIRKYESLRTYFVEIDGEAKQRILDEYEFAIEVIEIKVVSNMVSDSKELIHKTITAPFNLTDAPLIKVVLLKDSVKEDYILIINIHHIVLDEWSVNILADNLNLFYDHYSGKKLIADEHYFLPSSIQYKEYANWHNQQIVVNRDRANSHKEYWLKMFGEPVPCPDLPTDFQRPKVQTFEGKTESFKLLPDLSEGLRRLGAENDATLFIASLALFNILFFRYTKQNDIVIGTPVANRDHPDIQDQIGFFLNTLALRNQSDPAESFKSFLNTVKKNTLGAFGHQLYPFDMLVDDLQLPRDRSRSPLFDVMLISQTPMENGIKTLSGLGMKTIELEYPVSKFDLSISYYDDGNSIGYFFEYNTALFKKDRIVNMFNHFATLLESVLANVEAPISKLNIIPDGEMAMLMDRSFGPKVPVVHDSIVGLIEKTSMEFKETIAVVNKRERLSFGEVNSRANQLANYLIDEEKIRPEDRICVMLDRSEWSVIAMLAILKSGAVFVPVDSNYPQSRIDFILRDSGAEILITTDEFKKLPSFDGVKIIPIEEIRDRISGFDIENVTVMSLVDSQSTAYVIYTSGSTGEPKGVLGTHKCLLNLVEWQSGVIESGLKSLQYAPHNFDVSVQEILFSLASAGTLYLIDNETRYKMSAIAGMIEKEGIAILTMPYSALNLFLGELENIDQLKSIKHLITSGEQPFFNPTLSKLLKAYPEIQFHNQYGPSETHVVTSYVLSGSSEEQPNKIPIGRPINNTQILLLDNRMELVPTGIAGDLYIGGFNVANGYLNKTDLTNDRFIQNPFGKGKLYKSGDVARWNHNGELEFLGREDGQVKVRGYRVELGEIESCMLNYPDLREAAVKLIDDGENNEIAAYFTSNEEIEISRLKEFLVSRLPGYMVPGYFVKLDQFPHTASGKIDVRMLPIPDAADHSQLSGFVEPEGETEIAIAEVWSEILNRENIGSTDNFFETGGNSIKAIKVMSRIQKRLGKKTFLNLIFQHPTIREMAEIIVGMEDRLKNMDIEYIVLNQEQERKIFFLPPGIGYSFAYMEYAKYFEELAVYGLNFVETSDPAKSMADLLTTIQPEGAFYLFGHSAGGNMAFDVAIELQNRGRELGGLILLDSYRQLEVIAWSQEEYMNDAVLYIEQNHAEFLDEEIKEAALLKIAAYRKYLNSRAEDKFVNCPIIQIEASDEITNFSKNISRSAWGELTTRFDVFEGSGGHMDMLKQPNLERNALLTKKLFDELYDENEMRTLTGNINDNLSFSKKGV